MLQDILIDNEAKKLEKAEKRVLATELHIANRLHYSLRVMLISLL